VSLFNSISASENYLRLAVIDRLMHNARGLEMAGTRGILHRRHIIPRKLLLSFKANGIRLVRIDFGRQFASWPEKTANNGVAANGAADH